VTSFRGKIRGAGVRRPERRALAQVGTDAAKEPDTGFEGGESGFEHKLPGGLAEVHRMIVERVGVEDMIIEAPGAGASGLRMGHFRDTIARSIPVTREDVHTIPPPGSGRLQRGAVGVHGMTRGIGFEEELEIGSQPEEVTGREPDMLIIAVVHHDDRVLGEMVRGSDERPER